MSPRAAEMHRWPSWRADTLAGLSVAALLVPEAIAYAGIAGLPPGAGVMGVIAGLGLYAAFGRSHFAIVSGTSSAAALLAANLSALHAGSTGAPALAASAATLVLACGLCFFAAGALNLGRVSNLIARPVLRGYGCGLACVIAIHQLPHLAQLTPPASAALPTLWALLRAALHWWWPATLTGAAALLLLFVVERIRHLPAALLVAALGVIVGPALGRHGVALVGAFQLMPALALPAPPVAGAWLQTLQLGAALVLVLYAESVNAINSAAIRHGDPGAGNRDLFALGAANLASGLLRGLPVGAGFTATAVNDAAGAQSRGAAIIALVAAVALAFGAAPLLARLPQPVLAAIVIHAVSGAWRGRNFHDVFAWRRDRSLLLAAVAAVLLFGILNGLLIAVVLSIVLMLHRFMAPRLSELGRLHGGHDFVAIERHADAQAIPGVRILRPDEPLFFGNAEAIAQAVRARLQPTAGIHALVLSLEETPQLDSTAIAVIGELCDWLAARGQRLWIARAKHEVAAVLALAAFPGLPATHVVDGSVDDVVGEVMRLRCDDVSGNADALH